MSDQPHDIDWDAIWRSLNWSEGVENAQERLRQRARQYALPSRLTAVEDTQEERLTVLSLRLGTEHYGVLVTHVRAVRALSRITRVPGTPPFYRGVVNLRGQIITVLDLRLFLDVPITDNTTPSELVIVRAQGRSLELALLADHVIGVRTLPRSALQLSGEVRFALGVTPDRLVVLDMVQLLNSDRLIIGGTDE